MDREVEDSSGDPHLGNGDTQLSGQGNSRGFEARLKSIGSSMGATLSTAVHSESKILDSRERPHMVEGWRGI